MIPENIAKLVSQPDQTVVLVTGVFDVLHQAHQEFLKLARKQGDILIVGLEADKRVRELKGDDRPVNDQQTRLANIEGLVDAAFILPGDFHLVEKREALIKELKPNVLAVSSHTAHLEEKQRIMELVGGELRVVYDHQPDISSTKMIHSA